MTTGPIRLQDLRRRLYDKAKAEKDWRFWGLYVHVTKLETLRTAYAVAKKHNGAPGLDGVTFAAIEGAGVEQFLAELRDALVSRTYWPLRNRHVAIPKDGGPVRVLGIPTITAYCGAVQYAFRVPHRDAPVPPVGGTAAAGPLRASSSDRSHLYL